MDEAWARSLIVGGAVGLVVLVSWLSRRRRTGRSLSATGLDPGVYLFTSRTCGDCATARERLAERLGRDAFREVEWESSSTLVVAADGSGVWAEGVPSELGNP
jgi:hypothetical protein